MKLLLTILLFFGSLIIYSQASQQQLIRDFERLNSKPDVTSEETKQMIDICLKLTDLNPTESLLYLDKLAVWIEKKDDIINLNNFSDLIAVNYIAIGELDKGLTILRELYNKYESDLTAEQQVHFQLTILTVLDAMSDYEETSLLIKKIVPKLEQLESESKNFYLATVYSIRGSLFRVKGKYQETADDFIKALRFYEEDNNTMNVITMYNRLGLLYQEMQDYEKSVWYYTEGIRKAEAINSEWNLVSLYQNIGTVYEINNSFDKALDYEKKALDIVLKNDQQTAIPRIYSNIGSIYLSMKDYPKAFDYLKSSLELCYSLNIPEGMMHNYIKLGKAYTQAKQYDNAFSAYDSALVYVKKLVIPRAEISVYQEYSDLYKKTGNADKALEYYVKYHELEKELFSNEKQEAIARLDIEYQTELKDKEIEQTNSDLRTQEAENKFLFIVIISVVLAAGCLVFFLIYRNRVLKDLYKRNIELMDAFTRNIHTEEQQADHPEPTDSQEDNLKNIFKRLVFSLENEKLYTDPELSLAKISEKIKSNEKYVSSAIAVYAKTNYSVFINYYRINEAKRLMYETNNLNLNEVSYTCGFNSRTTFYNAFKKHTGMSPKQFKEMS